ncbi:YggS family pyridoxal phosphate-dependent enzyme [Segetibacter sp. 3557_3]|uniref:YggS family pyridoxal phosphate-dependent enzyme n=1 Tax=Segetibacter sp. 3557_3 TaxID=2547429 RepID=UPI0010588419|nr:YggS family pyridoxal phosphate-dependent enzyme [Segetibacter sp. 3557_3]TDH27384.1 YggS family pyridoxal phosphate-dependent enzyme [Segetibacter sp. 3557_3]
MGVNIELYRQILGVLEPAQVELVAVSKVRSAEEIMQLYNEGQRDFGENYVQELVDKQLMLPVDIRWHFIGHLQTNKVKQIAPFVHLIHGVDSTKLLAEINKQGKKHDRVINCLMQVHVAEEPNKFGLTEETLFDALAQVTQTPLEFSNVYIRGIMGMASFTDNREQIRGEFKFLKYLFDKYQSMASSNCALKTLSMGMSDDYEIAIEEGSNMVRIGSLLFGRRI